MYIYIYIDTYIDIDFLFLTIYTVVLHATFAKPKVRPPWLLPLRPGPRDLGRRAAATKPRKAGLGAAAQ